MKTLAVGGCSSGVGKTTLVCRLLETLPGWGALKISPVRPHACSEGPACPDCHGMKGAFQIVADPVELLREGSDTFLFHQAGAARLAWLLCLEDHLERGIPAAAAAFLDLPGLVVEGNSFARHVAPEKLVMVARAGLYEVKGGVPDLLASADWVVLNRPLGTAPEQVRGEVRRLVERHRVLRVVDLDAASSSDPATADFLCEVRAWARR